MTSKKIHHVLSQWPKLKNSLQKRTIFLFLDYDGTLAPFAEIPKKAFFPIATRALLEKLSKLSTCRLAIVSGRTLADIKMMVGIKNIIYVGNHGYEIESSSFRFENLASPIIRSTMEKVKHDVNRSLASFKMVFIEDKGLSLSIHYRQAVEKDQTTIKQIFNQIIKPYQLHQEVTIGYGNKVFDVKPPLKWDKGKAILWLLEKEKLLFEGKDILSIYVGDDATDEDAFRALKNKGITVLVGKPQATHAQYYLEDTQKVFEFLEKIYTLKQDV